MFPKPHLTNGLCVSTPNCTLKTGRCAHCRPKAANWHLALLTMMLAALKITGSIHCGWLWVLAPMWLPVAIFATVFIVLLTIKILHK